MQIFTSVKIGSTSNTQIILEVCWCSDICWLGGPLTERREGAMEYVGTNRVTAIIIKRSMDG